MSDINRALGQAVNPKSLELIILPTEKCNFRCTYCYETFEIDRMKPEIVQAVKNLIAARSGDLDTLRLSWFGGEPLLAAKTILDISAFAIEACQDTACEVLPGEITTNAYLLTRELLDDLVQARVKYFQITLDGYEESHDSSRRHAAGLPTFWRIMESLSIIKDSPYDTSVNLRLHIKPDNRDGLLKLAELLRRDYLPDRRFYTSLKEVGDWGGPNQGKIESVSAADAVIRRSELMEALGLSVKGPDTRAVQSPDGSPYICYASRPNSLLIRPDGRVGKCTVALDDPINEVARITPDGKLSFDNSRLQFWLTGLQTRQLDHLACPHHTVARPDSKIIPITRVS